MLRNKAKELALAVFWMVVFPLGAPSLLQAQPVYTIKIANAYPHDPGAYTQGLVYHEGFLYESTGLHGGSSLRKVELETGKVLQNYPVPSQFFAEGLTLWGNRLLQLTWRSRVGFVYDKDTFQKLREFTYDTEGWGLTNDGTSLIMSDGSSMLRYLDPETFIETRRLEVYADKAPVPNLNELEYIQGQIYANVWGKDLIVIISPKAGEVLAWIDLSSLKSALGPVRRVDVLNGIAYDPKGERIFVTGKLWPRLFEIEVVKK